MQPRTTQLLDKLSQDGNSVSEQHSAAIAIALTRYVDINLATEQDVRDYIVDAVDVLVRSIPLNIGAIYQYVYGIHQYRRTVQSGFFPNSVGGNDTTWLFGMNFYMSPMLISLLSTPELIGIIRNYASVLNDIVDNTEDSE